MQKSGSGHFFVDVVILNASLTEFIKYIRKGDGKEKSQQVYSTLSASDWNGFVCNFYNDNELLWQ